MIRVFNILFAEKVMLLADQRYMAAGIYPGGLAFNGPAGNLLLLDVLIAVGANTPGRHDIEFQLVGPNGAEIGSGGPVPVEVADPRICCHLAINNLQFPVTQPGALVVNLRPVGGQWMEAGRLEIAMPDVANAKAQLGPMMQGQVRLS